MNNPGRQFTGAVDGPQPKDRPVSAPTERDRVLQQLYDVRRNGIGNFDGMMKAVADALIFLVKAAK